MKDGFKIFDFWETISLSPRKAIRMVRDALDSGRSVVCYMFRFLDLPEELFAYFFKISCRRIVITSDISYTKNRRGKELRYFVSRGGFKVVYAGEISSFVYRLIEASADSKTQFFFSGYIYQYPDNFLKKKRKFNVVGFDFGNAKSYILVESKSNKYIFLAQSKNDVHLLDYIIESMRDIGNINHIEILRLNGKEKEKQSVLRLTAMRLILY